MILSQNWNVCNCLILIFFRLILNQQFNYKMKKKHDRVVLKSQVFKLKTTPDKLQAKKSKSPISKSPYMSKTEEEKYDANELFQKVCCPNCRFIFKIIKSSQPIGQFNLKKKIKKESFGMQTQDYLSGQIKDFKSLSSELNKQLSPRSKQFSPRSDSFGIKTSLLKKSMEKIQQEPSLQNRVQRKSSQVDDDLQVTSRINGNNRLDTRKNSLRLSEKRSQDSLSFDQSKLKIFEKSKGFESKLDTFQIKQEERNSQQMQNILLKLYQGRQLTKEYWQICTYLPKNLQIASYQKMLLHEWEDNPLFQRPIEYN